MTTTKPIPQLGYTGKVLIWKGVAIHERIVRVAYARNGNADNPTAYKEWDVYSSGGPGNGTLELRCQTLREAKRFIETGEA